MASNKHGLGRGIAALFADNQVSSGKSVIQIPLTKLTPNPYQPRTRFDHQGLVDLANSIRQDGVFQPIIVRESKHRNGYYEILAGERRFRASKLAQKATIPAIVRNATNSQMMEIAVMENLQREDLTPVEEAKAYETLMVKLNLTQVQVAKRLGKSRPYIANYLRLLSLPPKVKQMLQNRQLSAGQARALLAVPNHHQLIKLAEQVRKKSLTVKQINALIRNHRHSRHQQRSQTESPFARAAEEQLQDKFGTAVAIHDSRHHRGKLEIKYRSLDDLNRILKILKIDLN